MFFEKSQPTKQTSNQQTPVLHLEWKRADVAVSVTIERVMFIPGVTYRASTVN